MEERRRDVMVGLFVLLGLAAMAVLIIIFGQGPTWLMRRDSYPLHVNFAEVSGIKEGTLVTVKGIEIGRVSGVNLTAAAEPGMGQLVSLQAGVDVVLAIKSQYRLPVGSRAQTTEPVLGQGRPPIEIIPGPQGNAALEPGASIEGTLRGAIDSIFPPKIVGTFETTARNIGDAAAALTPVLEEARDILEKRAPRNVDQPGGPQGNLSSTIARIDTMVKNFNDVFGDEGVKNQARETVANARQMSIDGKQAIADLQAAAKESREAIADARQFVAQANSTVKNIDERVVSVSRALTETLDRTDHFLDQLNAIATKVSSGEGNVGHLFMDNKLYEAMQLTAERMAAAVEDFRALMVEWREKGMRARL